MFTRVTNYKQVHLRPSTPSARCGYDRSPPHVGDLTTVQVLYHSAPGNWYCRRRFVVLPRRRFRWACLGAHSSSRDRKGEKKEKKRKTLVRMCMYACDQRHFVFRLPHFPFFALIKNFFSSFLLFVGCFISLGPDFASEVFNDSFSHALNSAQPPAFLIHSPSFLLFVF